MPRAVFLLPGVGAQRGRVEDLRGGLRPHPAAGLITASRSIVNAYVDRGGDLADAAAAAAEEPRGGLGVVDGQQARVGVLHQAIAPAQGRRCTRVEHPPVVRSVFASAPPILRGACLGRPMPEDRRRRCPFRLLAPLAPSLCAAAIAAVVLSSNVVDSGNGNEAASTAMETARIRPPPSAETSAAALHGQAERQPGLHRREDRRPGGATGGAQPGARPTGTRGGPEDQAARVRATALLAAVPWRFCSPRPLRRHSPRLPPT